MSLPITKAVVGGFAAYSATVFLLKQLKRAISRITRSTDKSTVDMPLPKEIWFQILSEITINYPSDRTLLTLSLVNKSTYDFIAELYSRRNSSVRWKSPYTATPILCHFIRRKNREASSRVFTGKSNPLYGPWMDSNLLRSPENFWKFLALILTKPVWFRYYEAEAPRPNPGSAISVAFHFNRIKPLVSTLGILLTTPVLDLIWRKFKTGEYAWSNIWKVDMLYWRSPFKLLPLVLMLMTNQALEINFQNFNGVLIRTIIYLLASALQYGGASVILPILILSIVLTGTLFDKNFASRQEIWFTCFFSIIAMVILFPSTIVLLPYPIYYLFSAFILPKDFTIPLNFYTGFAASLIGGYLTARNYI